LPRSAFYRDQIGGNMWRSRVIRYKPDQDHLHCSAQLKQQPSAAQTKTEPAFCQLWLIVLHSGSQVLHSGSQAVANRLHVVSHYFSAF